MNGAILKITGKSSYSNFKYPNLTNISKGRYLELIYLGLSLLVVSMGLLIHFTTIATSTFVFIIIQIVAEAATGIMYPPSLIALQTEIQARDNATATSPLGFIRQLSTAISVVLGGVVLQNDMESIVKVCKLKLGRLLPRCSQVKKRQLTFADPEPGRGEDGSEEGFCGKPETNVDSVCLYCCNWIDMQCLHQETQLEPSA
jgi:hypothetical protein